MGHGAVESGMTAISNLERLREKFREIRDIVIRQDSQRTLEEAKFARAMSWGKLPEFYTIGGTVYHSVDGKMELVIGPDNMIVFPRDAGGEVKVIPVK